MIGNDLPRLFGIQESNRDFSQPSTWGKNQFNSSFPAALASYMASKDIEAVYLSIFDEKFAKASLPIKDLWGIPYDDPDLYFAFEAQYSPFQRYVVGTLPRTDLVTQKMRTGECLVGLEIKLTALPDNTTCMLDEDQYGSEIVVRPDTIVYLACSIAESLGDQVGDLLPLIEIDDWSEAEQVLPYVEEIIDSIKKVSFALEFSQRPFLLQPVWKTKGKSPDLSDLCLDVFVWSNAGFVHFISEIANYNAQKITRQTRTAIWLFKMFEVDPVSETSGR